MLNIQAAEPSVIDNVYEEEFEDELIAQEENIESTDDKAELAKQLYKQLIGGKLITDFTVEEQRIL